MKANFLAKGKWYIFGIIAVVVILSIGLSFCTWDSASISSALKGSTAYSKAGVYKLVKDTDSSKSVSVGDVVEFGDYYQDAEGKEKTPLAWRVVDIRMENNREVLYLLTEKIVAAGAFWGSERYFNSDGVEVGNQNPKENQRYNDSTVRAWLNSLKRTDGGVDFDTNNNSNKVFNGFYNEAFSQSEKNAIIARKIDGMKGSYYGDATPNIPKTYDSLPSEKVWLPSVTEIYGVNYVNVKRDNATNNKVYYGDNINDIQFKYFQGVPNNNPKVVGGPDLSSVLTAFAVYKGNFTNPLADAKKNVSERSEGNNYFWIQRSPYSEIADIAHTHPQAGLSWITSSRSICGIRPAICVAK